MHKQAALRGARVITFYLVWMPFTRNWNVSFFRPPMLRFYQGLQPGRFDP